MVLDVKSPRNDSAVAQLITVECLRRLFVGDPFKETKCLSMFLD